MPPSPHVSKPSDNSCGLQKNPNLLTTAYHTPVPPQGSLSTFYTLSHSMFQKYQNARTSLNKSLLYICTNSDKLHGVCLLKKNHRTQNDYTYKSTVYEREREYNINHHSQKLSHSKRTEEIRYGLLCSPSVRDVARNIPSQIRNHRSVQGTPWNQ